MRQTFRCLVVGPTWVGDMVMAQSLFIALKQRHRNCHLGVLATAGLAPLLQRMPQLDEVLILPVGHKQLNLKARWQVARRLKAKNYAQAIILQSSFKASLVPFWAGIPKRTGFLGEQRYGLLNDIRPLDKNHLPLNVQRFLALGNDNGDDNGDEYKDGQGVAADAIPPPALSSTKADQDAVRHKFQLGAGKMLALCPGAEFGAAKQWPARHYAEVAKAKLAQGWRIVLLGSASDAPICQAIHRLLTEAGDKVDEQVGNLGGKTSLAEVIDLIASAEAVVANDSGLMHIAAALQRPLVAVYGASSPQFTPPLSSNSNIVKLDLPCQPCFRRQCPLGHLNCLNQLEAAQVLPYLPQ